MGSQSEILTCFNCPHPVHKGECGGLYVYDRPGSPPGNARCFCRHEGHLPEDKMLRAERDAAIQRAEAAEREREHWKDSGFQFIESAGMAGVVFSSGDGGIAADIPVLSILKARIAKLEQKLELFRFWLAENIGDAGGLRALSDNPNTACLTIARGRIEGLEQAREADRKVIERLREAVEFTIAYIGEEPHITARLRVALSAAAPPPLAAELTGSNPDITGGMSTGEYIRSIRE